MTDQQLLKAYTSAHGEPLEDLANIVKDCLEEGMERKEAEDYAAELQKARIEEILNRE